MIMTDDKIDTPEEVTYDRYYNRRMMAWTSFICIIVIGTALLIFGLSSDERASRVDTLSFFIGTVFGVWVAVVTWYFGATTVNDQKGIR